MVFCTTTRWSIAGLGGATAVALIAHACGTAKTKGYDCPGADQILYGVVVKCGAEDIIGILVPQDLAFCAEDGASDCVATGAYRAINTTTVAAVDIRDGVTIGGITGVLKEVQESQEPSYADCSQDGQTDCIARLDFPAVDSANVEDKIKAGEIVGGISGIAVLDPIEVCISTGQVGCETTNLYKAIEDAKLRNCLQ